MNRSFKKSFLIMAILLVTCGFIFAGGNQEKASEYSGKEGRITVYLSGPAPMLNKLESVFEEKHGDVLEFVHMGCGPLRQRIWTELEAGMINADVFWGSDPLIFEALDKRGALEEYTPSGIDALKDRFRTSENYTLVNERYGVIIYNKDAVAEKPLNFEDLLGPGFTGGLCHADPAQSSTALALIAGLWDLSGTDGEFHRQLKDNGLFLTKKNSDVPSKIMEGEFLAGIAPHDAVLRLKNKANKEGYPIPLGLSWPEEGAVAIQRPIAISENDSRPDVNSEIAHAFIDFMISKPAQKITTNFGFISVRKDLPLPMGVPENLKIRNVDWIQLAETQNLINENFKKLYQ